MDTVGLIVAIFITLLFLLKFTLGFLGFSSDMELSEGDLFDVEWSDVFSLKGFLNFMFGFSWSWACFGLENYKWIIAILIGVACVVILAYTYYFLSKLEVEGVNEDINNLKGRKGTVYTIYGTEDNGFRKIACELLYNDKIEIMEVFTQDMVSVGDSVIVTEIFEDVIIYVKKI